MINIIIVDDHELIQIATSSLLSSYDNICVVGCASSASEGIALAKEKTPDIVLTDIDMPGTDGIELTRKLSRELKGTKVIALTRFAQSPYPEQILQAGAYGYINKGASSNLIIEAINRVMNGDKYISPEVANNLILKSINIVDDPFNRLTKREKDVAKWLSKGKTAQEVSKKLGVNIKTIFSHRAKVHSKLGTTKDTEISKLAETYNYKL